jgi:predicted dehydrogenase
VKIAIVGCGRIAHTQAAYVRREPDVSHFVTCDADRTAADHLASAFGGSASYSDVSSMLEQEQPDVVHVCTPPGAHAAVVVEALGAGAHVFVEKPLALTLHETTLIAQAMRESPGCLCVDHNFLFEPEMLAARRAIQEGWIGDVVSAEVFYGVEALDVAGSVRAWARDLPLGSFTDLLPHPLYLLAHVLGEARGVSAATGPSTRAADREPSELAVLLDCPRGIGTVRVSFAAAPYELSLTVRGTAGTVRVNFAKQQLTLARRRGSSRRVAQVMTGLDLAAQSVMGVAHRVAGKLSGNLRGYPGMRILIGRFYEAIRRELSPPVSLAEGTAVVAAMERIRASLSDNVEPPGSPRPLKKSA